MALPRGSRRGDRALALAVALATLCAAVAATAQAQQAADPYATTEQQAKQNDLDTDLTPVAKETELWSLVHGTGFGETEPVADSVTTFDTDLFAVSFRNRAIGLAGGSACAVTPEQQDGESDPEFGTRASECRGSGDAEAPRVPALFRYSEPRDSDAKWDRLELPGDEKPGYIGAIAWIDRDRALIVGGSGHYPRRELGPTDEDQYGRSNAIEEPTDPDKADVAGEARAWLFTRGPDSVSELDLSELTEDEPERAGMRGLTAVGCYADPTPGQRDAGPGLGLEADPDPDLELCFAGGLGQVWEWRDGAFNGRRIDALSEPAELRDAELFRYRVRDIGFPAEREPPIGVAVTAGCCAVSELENTPRLLVYDHMTRECNENGQDCSRRRGPPRWFALSRTDRTANALESPETNEINNERRTLNDTPELPDSAYSLAIHPGGYRHLGDFSYSVVASPGGPESGAERPSVISKTHTQPLPGPTTQRPDPSDPAPNAVRTALSTARLVSGDGDVATNDPRRPAGFETSASNLQIIPSPYDPLRTTSGPDGQPDWVVGELRSTERPGLGSRGLVVATALPPTVRDAVNEGRGTAPPAAEEVAEGEYTPLDQEKLAAHVRSRHYLLPSYTANSVEIVGDQEAGWAVGDHGAILRLATGELQSKVAAAEPKPPRLGAPRREPLSDRDSYRPPELPSTAGAVPALSGETVELDERRMIPSGDSGAGTVEQIVMSRDGSEGWAIGTDNRGATFSRFDGSRWTRCDPVGIPGVVEPDPACEEMAPLRGYRDSSGSVRTVNLDHVARVPLEWDDDPSNDDELEIVAFGGTYSGPENGGKSLPAFVRYRDGRWRFDDASQLAGIRTPSEIVFTGPADGWLVGQFGGTSNVALYHFDGHGWTNCVENPEACGDLDGRIPRREVEIAGLTVAGERVYLYGQRRVGAAGAGVPIDCLWACTNRSVPLIIYRDRGGEWTDGSGDGEDRGGFDPGFTDPATRAAGRVDSLSVTRRPDGGFEGWAVGEFDGVESPVGVGPRHVTPPVALMRLEPAASGGWRPFRSPGAFEDYMLSPLEGRKAPGSAKGLQVTYPLAAEADGAYIGQLEGRWGDGGRLFGFDGTRERFELLETARPQGNDVLALMGRARPYGDLTAMAPDGQGGFWAAVSGHMFRWSDRAPKHVFTETASPLGIRGASFTALEAGPDGSVWAATDSDRLYRYERGLGWEGVRTPGWDPGRVVTRASRASALAVGPGGEGLVVGEGGRIAELSPDGVMLDSAAGRSCALGDPAPCATSRDLTDVDIAPDGSAIAVGEALSLLWRPAGGEFRAISKPRTASSTTIRAVSYPRTDLAYVLTGNGIVFRGEMTSPGEWSWRVDLAADVEAGEKLLPLRDVALDSEGHGYAVGDGGLAFRHSPQTGWKRIPVAAAGDLSTIALPEAAGDGVLIGGADGLVLTGRGSDLRVARAADFHGTGSVIGIAYLPGTSEASVDAWVAIGSTVDSARLLRHRSEPDDPLLEPTVGLEPLADAPGPVDDELSIAAFGKSDCEIPEESICPEMSGSTTTNETIVRRVLDELSALEERDAVDLAVLTGDATDSAGRHGSSLGDFDKLTSGASAASPTTLAGQLKHRRFSELAVEELEEDGVSLFGALGGQDLTETIVCHTEGGCDSTKRVANAGENFSWREAFAGRMEPWGDGEDELDPDAVAEGSSGEAAPGEAEYEFVAVRGSDDGSVRVDDQKADADGEGAAPEAKAEIGGASTHYAVEAVRDGERVARIVFVDTSMKSLAASDPLQQPQEFAGGQQRFLERMICKEGATTSTGDECTRAKDQAAIVVSNTPTYSYGPGALTHTATDANVFEALVLKHDVDLVISGALGYNGLYYTLAPGIHEPCPGGEHPEGPPKGGLPSCAGGADGLTAPLEEQGVPDPRKLLEEQGLAGSVPTLIASGAGGKFGPDGQQQADGPAGQWHGYSIARLQPDGEVIFEQRPILDWIGMHAADHTLHAKARLKLNGYGRSPISTTTEDQLTRAFHYEIEGAAITHRYELVLADPDRPWLPCEAGEPDCEALHAKLSVNPGEPVPTSQLASAEEPANPSAANPCAPYLCLPKRIATVDRLSGEVKAKDGKYPETFAVAMLSVDDRVATYPLVFKPSPSFVVTPFEGPPSIPANASPSAPPPPSLPKPQIPSLTLPTPPSLPAIPPLVAATPPEPAPPAPPAPPPPSEQPSPLNLSVAPTGLTVATPTAVIQPPTPPVNPAPPGGARREARQRQAAAQKSGADNAEGVSEDSMRSDAADAPEGPHGAAMTRHAFSGARQKHSFTRFESRDPGASALLWSGGLTLAALALALTLTTVRPGSRRREPHLPAPAYNARSWRRRP